MICEECEKRLKWEGVAKGMYNWAVPYIVVKGHKTIEYLPFANKQMGWQAEKEPINPWDIKYRFHQLVVDGPCIVVFPHFSTFDGDDFGTMKEFGMVAYQGRYGYVATNDSDRGWRVKKKRCGDYWRSPSYTRPITALKNAAMKEHGPIVIRDKRTIKWLEQDGDGGKAPPYEAGCHQPAEGDG